MSSTIATVEFRPSEIFRADDARADAPPAPWHLSYSRSDEKKRQENPAKSEAPTMNDVRPHFPTTIHADTYRGVLESLGMLPEE